MTDTAVRPFSLGDRYTTISGQILATGVQALTRIPLDQMRADRRAGLHTAAFISGYQGSPLGGYDRELQSQRALLDELGIVHRPAVNEELGATAVMGSQLSATFPSHRYDGVLGIWYGKSPGVDRAGDAIRHGNYAGTSRRGGVLALTGDDPACKSSTLPSRSEATLAALGLVVLYPGTVQDVLDLGLHGVALSRASGLWTALKIVTPVADGSGTAEVDPGRIRPVIPALEVDGKPWTPTLTSQIVTPFTIALEGEIAGPRMEMARRYIAENGLNPLLVDPPRPWLGIVAGGHACEQVMEALATLGLDEDDLSDLGIRVLKLGALNPIDRDGIRRLAADTRTVLVVEDKTANVETLVRDALYGTAHHPEVLGKQDRDGLPLVPVTGALTAEVLVEPMRRVLMTTIAAERLAPPRPNQRLQLTLSPDAIRTPYFCSGCPHNTGTLVPEGALVGAGIGCHGMVSFMAGGGQRGTVVGITQMGGEGSQWIGVAPFVDAPHLFQNVGDGTFFHSGQLAVQAAVAAGVDMTFKLLYNAAVAMTGGQDATGLLPVPAVATKLLSEGVKEVIITTDEPGKYRGTTLPKGAKVMHRDKIIEAQEHLRSLPGVTVLIHDQQCAAEKRRDRKRGLLPKPGFRIMIDERVCEGCGDCGVQSNCLSLQPIDTEFGRKTVIDQASCNLDVSCVKGDCPAFVTVRLAKDGSRRRAGGELDGTATPEPRRVVPAAGVTIRMPGIGGTGVVTVSQMLAAAARMEEIPTHSVDQTGLSQKAGPVVSTISIGEPEAGRVDVLLGFDLLASVTTANLSGLDPAASVVVASSTITPTGRMVGRVATANLDPSPLMAELEARSRPASNRYVDASRLTAGLLGDAVTANVFLLGVAYQAGVLPVTAASIERAIDLNGTAVELNTQAFRWGRLWVVDPARVESQAGVRTAPAGGTDGLEEFADDAELQRMLSIRVAELTAYQDRRYAWRYLEVVRRCHAAERSAASDGSFTRTVAHHLHRLMAYKDEYEVARLLLDGGAQVERAFGDVDRVTWNLHPPMLRAVGLKRKLKLGPWARPALTGLRSMKRVRGTALDPFGRAEVRRTERRLIEEYRDLVDELLPLLPTDPARAVHLAGLVDVVRGYEGVKMRNVEAYRAALADARAGRPPAPPPPVGGIR